MYQGCAKSIFKKRYAISENAISPKCETKKNAIDDKLKNAINAIKTISQKKREAIIIKILSVVKSIKKKFSP